MIALLRGQVVSRSGDWVVIDVGGIGYRVSVSSRTMGNMPPPGSRVEVHTAFCVREDSFSLYGFFEPAERELFEVLLGVSQVGPRVALAVLGTFTPSEFRGALATEDVNLLTRIPGIGAKTARRLILELRDRVSGDPLEVAGGALSPESEAVSALVALGYSIQEATSAVRSASGKSPGAAVEDLVRASLTHLYGMAGRGRG